MALISIRQLLDHAYENNYGMPIFTISKNEINNMQDVFMALRKLDTPDAPSIFYYIFFLYLYHEYLLSEFKKELFLFSYLDNIDKSLRRVVIHKTSSAYRRIGLLNSFLTIIINHITNLGDYPKASIYEQWVSPVLGVFPYEKQEGNNRREY